MGIGPNNFWAPCNMMSFNINFFLLQFLNFEISICICWAAKIDWIYWRRAVYKEFFLLSSFIRWWGWWENLLKTLPRVPTKGVSIRACSRKCGMAWQRDWWKGVEVIWKNFREQKAIGKWWGFMKKGTNQMSTNPFPHPLILDYSGGPPLDGRNIRSVRKLFSKC